jgi:hypothetical protein
MIGSRLPKLLSHDQGSVSRHVHGFTRARDGGALDLAPQKYVLLLLHLLESYLRLRDGYLSIARRLFSSYASKKRVPIVCYLSWGVKGVSPSKKIPNLSRFTS